MSFCKVSAIHSSQPLASDADACRILTGFLRSEQEKLHAHQRHGYWDDLYALTRTLASTTEEQELLDQLQEHVKEDDDEPPAEALAYSSPGAGQSNVGYVKQQEGEPIVKMEEESSKKAKKSAKKEKKEAKKAKKVAKKEKKEAKKAKKRKRE